MSWITPFTPTRIFMCFVENSSPNGITSMYFFGKPVRTNFASRHPKNNKVSLKVQKSCNLRKIYKNWWLKTSGAKPLWAKFAFTLKTINSHTRKHQILRARRTCFMLQNNCFTSTRPYVLRYLVKVAMLLHQKEFFKTRILYFSCTPPQK